MQPEAAYSNPPESKSENINAPVTFYEMQLAQTIYELYLMGLIKEVVDRNGVPRWTPLPERQ